MKDIDKTGCNMKTILVQIIYKPTFLEEKYHVKT